MVVLLADAVVAASYLFTALVMKTNSYASRIVEVEEDQRLVRTGPYAVVRHPMYASAAVMFFATPIALGSWWGLLPMAVVPMILVPRILNEEKVLRGGLEGYNDYCDEVRWRILPLVW